MQNTFIKKINTFIKEKNLIPQNSTLIIGLSGGPDSVFLLHILAAVQKEKNLTLIAAHLDHGWRTESANDAQFCKDLAHSYGIPFSSKTMADLNLALKFNGSKEEIGRKARRSFFESLAKEYNAHAIALAHHADDQMETFFIRMIRGASLAGLAGMKTKDGIYIRPLLKTKKEEILAYLKENKISYVIDESNSSDKYLRNRIRNTVIPALHATDSRFCDTFENTHIQLQETEEFLQALTKSTLQKISTDSRSIELSQLNSLHPALKNRILIEWLCANKISFTPSLGLLEEIIKFLNQPNDGTHTFYNKWRVCKKKDTLTIVHI